ncbi:hypothetical protein ACFZDM_33145 [Streptomyces californicus]|uniref:hypothetical protein n=1 Tax=Streptomyces californicus TaxID=67351 RepID=UPI0036F0A336
MRLHPTTGDPACESIHLAITTWGALHQDAWQLPEDLSPTQLAAAIGQYANLVRTPTGVPGTCGHRLMGDLRPPEHRHTVTRALVARGVPSALTTRADPAPCEAPPGHQLAGEDTLADTDIDWWRPPTPEEATRPHVVCFAVNLHHFADSNNIRVSDAPAEHVFHPAFDSKTPGSWFVDLSESNPHPLLPPAFASNGLAWHTTPALAYATLRGLRPQPVRAWLRLKRSNPYLDPWYERVRKARLAVLQSLGLTTDLDTPDLLTALGDLPRADRVQRALLKALDATAQDAFTVLDRPPAQPDQALLSSWPTPDDPTWRPDLRAAVTANARANVHRKLSRTARDGNIPLAVSGGHLLYATHTHTRPDRDHRSTQLRVQDWPLTRQDQTRSSASHGLVPGPVHRQHQCRTHPQELLRILVSNPEAQALPRRTTATYSSTETGRPSRHARQEASSNGPCPTPPTWG